MTPAGVVRVGFDLPVRADVPAKHDTIRRFEGENAGPVALATVDGAIVDVSADAWFEHGFRYIRAEQIVFWRLEVTESFCEHREGPFDGRVDDDLTADDHSIGLVHDCSFYCCSTTLR